MDTITAAGATLADIVATNSATARVFDRLGLDYCCHGEQLLADAVIAAGLDPAAVSAELAALPTVDQPWVDLDIAALADHVFDVHHQYLHEELPLLDALAEKVLGVHGSAHPELAEVRRLVAAIRADLEPHLMKEEQILFPAIHAIADGARDFPFGSVANPIRMMMLEHEQTGELLEALRAATDSYAVPDDACASYRSLYERLAAMEADTHLHIHKENHILFPTAIRVSEEASA